MRILITGAAGYLGQQLIKELAHHEITARSTPITAQRSDLGHL